MKTKMKFIMSLLMVLSIVITSCSKDGDVGPAGPAGQQGETGPAGQDGEDGEALGVPGPQGDTGADGEDGEDGEDGNANVIASEWIEADFPAAYSFSRASVTIEDNQITQEVINTYTILSYFSYNSDHSSSFQIPFTEPLLRAFTMQMLVGLGELTFTEYRSLEDGAESFNPIDGYIRYVLIAPSSMSGKQASLDYSSMTYEEVMDHFGLDY